MVGLSLGEKQFIHGGVEQNMRGDGRRRETYRSILIETGVIPQANGSARVRLGATEVIATVKAELGKPAPTQPDKGKVSIFVDCSAVAGPNFEARGGEELAAELSQALQSCMLSSCVDPSSLLLSAGKVCWDIYIDGLVISSDGNLLDALGFAVKAALSNTGVPRVSVSGEEQQEVDVSDEEFLQFDTSMVPVIVTLTKIGKHYIADATLKEESEMSSAVSMSVNRRGHVCGLTKRGGDGLDPSVVMDMVSVAKHISERLFNVLDSGILAAEARESDS